MNAPINSNPFVTDNLMLYCSGGVKTFTPGVLDGDGFTQWVCSLNSAYAACCRVAKRARLR